VSTFMKNDDDLFFVDANVLVYAPLKATHETT
jgi:hypothetical protein